MLGVWKAKLGQRSLGTQPIWTEPQVAIFKLCQRRQLSIGCYVFRGILGRLEMSCSKLVCVGQTSSFPHGRCTASRLAIRC